MERQHDGNSERTMVDRNIAPSRPPPSSKVREPHPEESNAKTGSANSLELSVAGILAEILGLDAIDPDANFFEAGGDSLLAMQAITRFSSDLGLDISLIEFFDAPTAAQIAVTLACLDRQAFPIERGLQNEHMPLSSSQRRMWFIDRLEGGSPAYHICEALRLRGPLNLHALRVALDAVIDRHESLRTIFYEIDGEPVQAVLQNQRGLLQMIDLRDLTAEAEAAEVALNIADELRSPFDLSSGPLIRSRLLQLTDREYVLILAMHHIVSDGWSLGVLLQEISAEYQSHQTGRGEVLPRLAIQYGDYARWQQQWLTGPDVSLQLSYWKEHLEGAPSLLELPYDRPRPEAQTFIGRSAPLFIEPALAESLRDLCQRLNLTLAMVTFVAWAIVLSRLSGQSDVVIGIPVANRRRSEIEGLIGFFVNTLAIRLRLNDSERLCDLFQRAKENMLQAYSHQDVPFELVVASLRPERSLKYSPIFQVMFAFQNTPPGALSLPDIQVSREPVPVETAQFDLSLSLNESNDALVGSLNYATDLVDEGTAERWVSHFHHILCQMADSVTATTETLTLISHQQGRRLLESLNTVRFPQEQLLIHELFSRQAQRTPSEPAATFEGRSVSYAALEARSTYLAHQLADAGAGRNAVVCVCMERGLNLITALLGILKSGAAYLALDPDHPADRLRFILSDAAPVVLVTQESIFSRLPPLQTGTLILDNDWTSSVDVEAPSSAPATKPERLRDLAYVIYTSGSTGVPKGVLVEHRNVVNHWQAIDRLYSQPFECRRIGLNAPVTFDASVQQLVQILSGRTLVIIPQSARLDAARLLELLQTEQIEGIDCTPSQLAVWISAGLLERKEIPLRTVLVGGEPIDPVLWKQLAQCRHIAFYNVYGPTECTVDSTCTLITELSTDPHIGRPLGNTGIYVLDGQYRVVPPGVPGEIYIGGGGVARGYLNRAALTAEHFLPDPFDGSRQDRMYKTGDLGRWRPNGALVYLGRNDRQVKIRGVRIELGEIEAQLLNHASVEDAAVIVRDAPDGEKQLIAYVVPVGHQQPRLETLRSHLRLALPESMVPRAFVVLDKFPLTPSGKLDRMALPAPELNMFVSQAYEPPQGGIEQYLAMIWCDLLGLEKVGREHDFFSIGGHSLLAIKMLFKIKQRMVTKLTLADLYGAPTIRQLAARIAGARREEQLVDLAVEATLPDTIIAKSKVEHSTTQAIFVTGATGFVGRFLLYQLLQDTSGTIYCLVRANSDQEPTRKLKAILTHWGLWQDGFTSRLIACRGDLGMPKLGLSPEVYDQLCKQIDVIYHCGTRMNHFETYPMCRSTNVDSAHEILKIATQCKPKLVNFISTLGIFTDLKSGRVRVVDEETSIERERHPLSHGYAASKWVGERIFLIARERGIPCNIFRLGLVWADTMRGRYDELQREYRILKSSFLSGYGIRDYHYELAPTPVDYVAKAIVVLSRRHPEGDGTFHISSPCGHLAGLFEHCNQITGTVLTLVPYSEWAHHVRQLHRQGRTLPALPLVEYTSSGGDSYIQTHNDAGIQFDCTRTLEELEHAGVATPTVDTRMLRLHLEDLFTRDVELKQWAATSRLEFVSLRYA